MVVDKVELRDEGELEGNYEVGCHGILAEPAYGVIDNIWDVLHDPRRELCPPSVLTDYLHHGEACEHDDETDSEAMPEGRNGEGDEHGHELHLASRLLPVHQPHHDVVLQPVVDLDVPAVDGLEPAFLR